MTTPGNLSEQILALPSGAGAVGSVGQTFSADPYTGTGRYEVPIEVQPGHAGLAPALSLVYSTHAGAGLCGLGWSLGLASVQRRIDKGLPSFDDDLDAFALQGDELLPVGGGHYRLRIEGRFARVRHVRGGGEDFWVVTERDGTRVFYGEVPDHRLHAGPGQIATWYVSRKQDANGNEATFTYERDRTTRDVRLASVQWAGCYRVVFVYEDRPDPIRSARTGFSHVQDKRLARVDVQVRRTSSGAWHTYREVQLEYAVSTWTGRSLLTSVEVVGIDAEDERHALPELRFDYTSPDLGDRQWQDVQGAVPGRSLSERSISLVRQSGSGLPDVIETTATGHWLRVNLGQSTLARPRRVASPAQVALDQQGVFVSDMSGDGWGDLVVAGGSRVYRGVPGGGWGTPYTSAVAPSVDLDEPGVRVVDLDGDGLPDALRAGSGGWQVFRNLGEGRWAPPVVLLHTPPLRLDDPRVHLADLSGDGLPDLVYAEGYRIVVWPCEGFGRWGDPIVMQNSPAFGRSFVPRALRFVDLTGSGQADLLYVRAGEVHAAFNQGGTGFSDLVLLGRRRQSSWGHVEPVDLNGRGAQGLLFTDRGRWSFLDLFPEGNPDLLESLDNGLGATTTLAYTSSAAHWVRDRQASAPWRTHMPSPQRVVDTVTTYDAVTGITLGVSYRYHHGVYDGQEREFRGFAQVEQIDREAGADDPQPLSQVLVRRWYHTGSDVDLRREFCPHPMGALADEVPAVPWARRSLRGSLRREETYALDGEPRPYLVSETAYRVFPVLRTGNTRRYSFAPLPIRTRTTHTERTHHRRVVETTTTYDLHTGKGYGLPVEVREKGYGRAGSFTTAHEFQQTEDLERYTVTTYVKKDEPDGDYQAAYSPHYLVGRPSVVERYGVTETGDVLLSRERYFYDGDDYEGLGYPGSGTTAGVIRGRLSCKLTLALTSGLLDTYPSGSGFQSALNSEGHYLYDGTGTYLHAERYAYDDEGRGMIVGSKDPDGNLSTFDYDTTYDLFPVKHTDPAGHPTNLTRGELPFQVAEVVDANANHTTFGYDPTGLPAWKAVKGKYKSGAWQGDPETHPTEQYSYDFTTSPLTIVVKTRQERLGATFDVHRYVDGLGRTIQEVHTAEPDPVTLDTRYRVTGWQVFNHKGLVVKGYQPTFTDSTDYEEGEQDTACIETTYDPLGRPIRIDHPDGTYETTTYHPWVQSFSDRNDNASDIESTDARYGRCLKTFASHLDTPTLKYIDALGREIAVAEDNGEAVDIEQTFRITSHQIPAGEFTGTTYDLQLDHDLSAHYFVMIHGTVDAAGPDADNVGVRVTQDPFGSGNLGTSSGSAVLRLERGASHEGDWQGVVVVWECLADTAHSGFQLIDVKTVSMAAFTTATAKQTVTTTANSSWSDLSRIALYGGPRGGGASTTSVDEFGYQSISAKVVPSSTNTITAERWSRVTLGAADFTVYVVQWGDEHTIQRVTLTGNSGGDGIDATSEYDTASIDEVRREHTWVWMSGWSKLNRIGNSFFSMVPTLGDGVNLDEAEDEVSVGSESTANRDMLVTVHTHPQLAVDWQFKTDGGATEASRTYEVLPASRSESYDETSTPKTTSGARIALPHHSSEGTGGLYARVLWLPRHTAPVDLGVERKRTGQDYAGWVQSADFGGVDHKSEATQSFRVTTYQIDAGQFTGTTYDLQLEQDLCEDYFVMIYGTVGTSAPGADNVGVRVTHDPFGTGDLSESGAPDKIRLERGASDEGNWLGMVVVWESLRDAERSGFRLVDAKEVALSAYATSASEQTASVTANAKWTDLDQVALYGGMRGGGIAAPSATAADYPSLAVKLTPSGEDSIGASRWSVLSLLAATTTVYVVQWGTEHHIQRVLVSGTAGGNGVNAADEYDTATIDEVARAHTWCSMSGWSKDNGIGDGPFGLVLALGDGVDQDDTETSVAVGSEHNDEKSALVTVHAHPSFAVDWVFKADGDSTQLNHTYTVDAATGAESYDESSNPRTTAGARVALHTNTCQGTGNFYGRVLWCARPTGSTTVLAKRTDQQDPYSNWCAWLQSIDGASVRVKRQHVTRSVLDLADQVIEVHDARDLGFATWTFTYDYAGRRIKSHHATALGERYALADAAGNPIWSLDARDIEVTRTFDELNRPLEEVSTTDSVAKRRRMWTYIDYVPADPDFSTYQDANLFGQVEEERDADGVRFFEYDWRGLVTKASHRFWDVDWTNASATVWTQAAAWDPEVVNTARGSVSSWLSLSHLDDTTTMEVTTTYDAAGRPLVTEYPSFTEDSTSKCFKTRNTYNAAGMLESVEVDRDTAYETVIEDATYNARGQVTGFTQGNGVETTREYDADLERLSRLFAKLTNGTTTHYQDLRYAYDPVGNPVAIEDRLHKSQYKANQVIPNTKTFRYDPRYRLIRATGRKHATLAPDPTSAITSPDPNDYEAYDYRYAYDEVGNFLVNDEYGGGSDRHMRYKAGRLDLYNGPKSQATDPDPEGGNWTYDENGNTTHTPRHYELAYTHDNQPRYVQIDSSGDQKVRYLRHADQRVVRLVKKNGVKALGIYLGPFEYHRRISGSTDVYTKLVLHVEGHGRNSQVEEVLDGTDSDSLGIFFVHGDHLGSGHVLTKDDGTLLSQEEYLPYGRSSDRRDTRNRYRFIGVERDEDTRLCMTGPRTYDPVLGRFLQGDPIPSRLRSPFVYSSSCPAHRVDCSGYQDEQPFNAPESKDISSLSVASTDEQASFFGLSVSDSPSLPGEISPSELQSLSEAWVGLASGETIQLMSYGYGGREMTSQLHRLLQDVPRFRESFVDLHQSLMSHGEHLRIAVSMGTDVPIEQYEGPVVRRPMIDALDIAQLPRSPTSGAQTSQASIYTHFFEERRAAIEIGSLFPDWTRSEIQEAAHLHAVRQEEALFADYSLSGYSRPTHGGIPGAVLRPDARSPIDIEFPYTSGTEVFDVSNVVLSRRR